MCALWICGRTAVETEDRRITLLSLGITCEKPHSHVQEDEKLRHQGETLEDVLRRHLCVSRGQIKVVEIPLVGQAHSGEVFDTFSAVF